VGCVPQDQRCRRVPPPRVRPRWRVARRGRWGVLGRWAPSAAARAAAARPTCTSTHRRPRACSHGPTPQLGRAVASHASNPCPPPVLAATGPSPHRCSVASCRSTGEPEGAPRSRSRPTTTGTTHAHGSRPVTSAGHCCSMPLVQPPSRGASSTPAPLSWACLCGRYGRGVVESPVRGQHFQARAASHDSDRTHSEDAVTTRASPSYGPRAYPGRRRCCAGAEPQVRHPTLRHVYIIDPALSASTVVRRTPPSPRVWRPNTAISPPSLGGPLNQPTGTGGGGFGGYDE